MSLPGDLRQAGRQLAARPGFALTALVGSFSGHFPGTHRF